MIALRAESVVQNLILNETAGNIGKIILVRECHLSFDGDLMSVQTHTANLVVKAWDDPSINVQHITEDILQCLCVVSHSVYRYDVTLIGRRQLPP